MLIKCLIKRDGGSFVELALNMVTYHFRPAADIAVDDPQFMLADHVCDVTDPQAVKWFLGVSAYELVMPDDAAVAKTIISTPDTGTPDSDDDPDDSKGAALAAADGVNVATMDKMGIFDFVTRQLPELTLKTETPLPTLRKQVLKGLAAQAKAKAVANAQAVLDAAQAALLNATDDSQLPALKSAVDAAKATLVATQAQ